MCQKIDKVEVAARRIRFSTLDVFSRCSSALAPRAWEGETRGSPALVGSLLLATYVEFDLQSAEYRDGIRGFYQSTASMSRCQQVISA